MDRLPDFADPERSGITSEVVVRGRLEQWLERRLAERMSPSGLRSAL